MIKKLNTSIEIHNEDTNQTGIYSVWYKDNGVLHKRNLSETYVNSLLSMGQKESFFMGKFRFKINEYDFKTIILRGELRKGFDGYM